MPEQKSQTYRNHVRFHPLFHFVFAPVACLLLIWSLANLVRFPSLAALRQALIAMSILLAGYLARTYALKVQDRVIRLEERLRMANLLPDHLRSAGHTLSEAQLIALRFASDTELAELVERTERDRLNGKTIKQQIRNWRPDYWRV